MKLISLIFLLIITKLSAGQSISCTYTDQPYTCNLQIQNPQGNDFESIPGEHLPGRGNGDVEVVRALSQNTQNIPKIICFQFQNMTSFTIVRSQVSVLTSGSFAYCENLQRLELYNNLITEIPDNAFYSSRNLRVLDINSNRLTALSENSFTGSALESIDFNFNYFENFDGNWLLSVNETLTSLGLMQNRFYNLSSGVFDNLRNLRSLNIGTNYFTDLPADIFINLSNLEVLFLQGNRITNLRASWFNQLTALTELRLEFNLIGVLPARIFANNNQLRDLGISFNQITTLDRNSFGNLENLRSLYAEINNINAIDPALFDNATSLNGFYLYDNICIRRNLLNINETRSEVRSLLQSCFDNFFSTSSIHCTYLTSPGLPYTCELSLENPTLRDDFERIEGEHLEGSADVDVIRVEGYWQFSPNIPTIICTQFTSLEELVLSSSKIEIITNYALENCVNLKLLNLENNNITTIPSLTFSHNVNLEILDFFNNHIDFIGNYPFDGTKLWYLDLEANDLYYFDPAWWTSIKDTLLLLNMAVNDLRILGNNSFSELENLVELEVGFNPYWYIEPSAFSGLPNLDYLSLLNCSLTELNPAWFDGLSSLSTLHLERNLLTELPPAVFTPLTNLRDLYIYQNNLTAISSNSFSPTLKFLRTFNAQFNRINEIDVNFFNRAENLYSLFLFGNLCGSFNLINVVNSREQVRSLLSTCFRNFGYLECNYIDIQPYGYFCELTIVNAVGRDFERIEGSHQVDRSDEDVFRVEAMDQETLNVPSIICRQFPNLRELFIIESHVEVVTAESLQNCRNLEAINMAVNRIRELPDNLFGNSPNLQIAAFYWNEISQISESAFAGTHIWEIELELNRLTHFNPRWFEPINATLVYISLIENHITSLPESSFTNIRNLIELELGYNPFQDISPNAFLGLEQLRDFGLDNCELNEVNAYWFMGMPELRRSHLQYNNLRTLPDGLHASNNQLFELNVAGNQLQLLQNEILGNPQNIERIFAYNNRILSFDPNMFENAERLNNLHLGNNICLSANFNNIINNNLRDEVRQRLDQCFTEFALERTISCDYSDDPMFNYSCSALIRNIRGFDGFETIPGDHLEGQSNSDVEFLFGFQQNTGNVPEIFCSQFPNLKHFYLSRSNVNQLSSRALAGCSHLESVNFEHNQIWSIPSLMFANNSNLEILNFNDNQIQNIAVDAFVGIRLTQITLESNWLRQFDPAWLSFARDSLFYLNIAGNRLQSLPELAFFESQVLAEINLNGNQGVEIAENTFRGLSSLQNLRMDDCGLTTLNSSWFNDLTSLRRLYLAQNSLDDLPVGVFSALSNLTYLYIQTNSIQLITSDWFGDNIANIEYFAAQTNRIDFIDPEFFEASTSLRTLLLLNNQCASVNAQNVQNNRDQVRNSLQPCFDNFLTSPPADITCDYRYDFPYTCYLTLNNRHSRNNFERVGGVHQSGRNDDDVLLLEAVGQNSPIVPQILCRQFRNLNYVYIINSGLRALTVGSFSECPNLITLVLDSNRITDIPDGFLRAPNLMQFSAAANRIQRVGSRVFEGTQLILVDLEQNWIAELDVDIFQPIAETLLYLLLQNNQIWTIRNGTLRNLTNLNYLELSNNDFSELPGNSFDSLQSLNFLGLRSVGLTSLPPQLFANIQQITEINISNNQIDEIPNNFFSTLANLQYLNIDYLNLSVLNSTSFGDSLSSLLYLRARSNRIDAIDPLIVDNASSLTQLYLLNNICTDMNFQDVQGNIEEVRGELWRCFGNFGN